MRSDKDELKMKATAEATFSTAGQFEVPAVVEIESFTFAETRRLAHTPSNRRLQETVRMLSGKVRDLSGKPVDCSRLHFIEFLDLTISMNYYFKQGMTDEVTVWRDVDGKREEKVVSVNLKDLITEPLPKEFKEPFKVGKGVFRFLKIGDSIDAMNYIKNKYAYEFEQSLSGKYSRVESEDFDALVRYETEMFHLASQLKGWDGKMFGSFDEALACVKGSDITAEVMNEFTKRSKEVSEYGFQNYIVEGKTKIKWRLL